MRKQICFKGTCKNLFFWGNSPKKFSLLLQISRKGNLSVELITAVIIFALISVSFFSYTQNTLSYSNKLEKKLIKNIILTSELNKTIIYNNWQENTVLTDVYIDIFHVENRFDSYRKSFDISITDTVTNQIHVYNYTIFPYWKGDNP